MIYTKIGTLRCHLSDRSKKFSFKIRLNGHRITHKKEPKYFLENQKKNFSANMRTNNVFSREFDSLSNETVLMVIGNNI
jgi:hypothetical protein